MRVNRIKLAVLAFVFLGAVANGEGLAGREPARQAGKPDLRRGTAIGDDVNLKPGPGRMLVVGALLHSDRDAGAERGSHVLFLAQMEQWRWASRAVAGRRGRACRQ